ncbi:hypothetical protein [Mycobacterium camsae]|uniref:hypothetical protein n=1 Tax=Mycobacterium gordonae TaxID=1778 RepID=UPI0019817872|nr:hypothetical protein [Mycobacterium gordonae]
MGGKFRINTAGMKKLERDLQKKFSGGVRVPLEGSESDAVQSVKRQLEDMGAVPNESEVKKMVRKSRENS